MALKPTNTLNPAKKPTCNTPVPASNPAAVKKKILVVDDNVQIRQSLQKVLCEEGYEVVVAADGREGIEKFSAERINMILLDVSLPDISGWDVFGTVTSLNPLVPIIIITGRNEQHDLAVLSGVGALIEKPLNMPMLLQNVAEIFAETSETHLKRLVGLHSNLRHVQPIHSIPGQQKASALRDR